MRLRRELFALAVGAMVATVVSFVPAPGSLAATTTGTPVTAATACSAPAWAEGTSYPAGSRVTYQSRTYEALVTHTAVPGAGWNPVAAPSLWRDLGPCDGGPPSPTPTGT
ncbi:carbohydrate-binding protein, partial [Micromonospora echinofusca]|uniref:carbohydrate-binding protein n=1 Tax=Micromonospora echinofusca TaxID=47858 RepID=UPI0034D4FA6F